MIESLEDMLVRHEGEILHAYQDSEGYWTIGVGRLIDPRLGGGITRDESRYLLRNDIQKAATAAKTFPWYEGINNARKQVVVDMIFNMGLPRFSGFKKMIAAIEAGDFTTAHLEGLDSKWARQVKGRATELMEIMKTGNL